jgi:2-aminoadipate transaminase
MNELPITQARLRPGIIDLGLGNPDISLLPLGLLHNAAETYFTRGDARSLQYGAEQGDGYFRHALADFLTSDYGVWIDPDLLFITAGASSALDLLCTLYTQPGDAIFVEEPSYFLALRVFKDHGLSVISIPMDEDGLRLDALEELLTQHHPKFIYTIPTFQNPSGCTLTQERRDKLVEFAQQYDFLVLADEVYHSLPYSQTPPKPFAAYTGDNEQVISVNSFSKILAPGLRLGWIQAHKTAIKRLAGCGLLDSGGGMNPFTSALVRGLIESGGLAENVAMLRREYANRLNTLDTALRRYLPSAEYTVPQGGFFFWVKLPGVDAVELRQRAQEFHVDFRQGALFSSQMGMRDTIRLCFSFYKPEEIEEGVKRLRDCL